MRRRVSPRLRSQRLFRLKYVIMLLGQRRLLRRIFPYRAVDVKFSSL